MSETVTVTAETLNNITLDSQAISRGLDAQQLRDLPREQPRHPVVPAAQPERRRRQRTDIQFLGGRDLRRVVHPGRPGLDQRDLRHGRQLGARPRRGRGDAGADELVQRRVRRPRRRRGHDQAREQRLPRQRVLRLQPRRVERAHLQPEARGRRARRPALRDARAALGRQLRRADRRTASCSSSPTTRASNDKAIYGGGRATVPTEAMRNGDFRGTSIKPIDPLTGVEFADQVIPSDRIDPVAQKVMNFFYPLPNQGTVNGGYGVYQQFRPETRERQRTDAPARRAADRQRLDVLPRASYQHRDPNSIIFEAGNALTHLPIARHETQHRGRRSAAGRRSSRRPSSTSSAWATTSTPRSGRARSSRRRSARSSGSRPRRASALTACGFPSINFQSGTFRPTNIADAARNVDRTVNQNAFSISDNFTWIRGGHSIKTGALWNRNMARDGFGFGVNFRGQYRFNARATGNALHRLPARRPSDVRDQVTGRGPLDGHSDDFAVFVQDDWKDRQRPHALPRPALRRRRRVAREGRDDRQLLAEDGGHHIVPSAEVAAQAAAGAHRSRPHAHRRARSGGPTRSSTATRTTSARASASPGGSTRATRRCCAAASASSTRRWPSRASATCSRTNEFRYVNTYRGGGLQQRLLGRHPVLRPGGLRQPGHRPEPREPRHLPVQPDARARAARRLRPARELHGLDDAEAAGGPRLQHAARRARLRSTRRPGGLRAACPTPQYGYYMDVTGNFGRGPVPRRSSSS